MRNTRNLKRLVALSAALLLVVGLALAPGAAFLGAGVTFVVVVASTATTSRPAVETASRGTGWFGRFNTALNRWPPGQTMSDDSTMMNAAATAAPVRRARKNHFETDMRFCGDRISMRRANTAMATTRGPTPMGFLSVFKMSRSADETGSRTPMNDNGQFLSDATTMLKDLGAKVHASFENALNIGLFSYRARDRGMALGLAA